MLSKLSDFADDIFISFHILDQTGGCRIRRRSCQTRFCIAEHINDSIRLLHEAVYSSFLPSLCPSSRRARHDDGSGLPINFPSTVLVSECPITSNNGHPRAIYRVCAARMSPEEILRPPRNFEASRTSFGIDPPELPARFVQSDIAAASFVPKENM